MALVLSEERLLGIARRIADVAGVVGVVLGGSRARGDHAPDSDVDLGLYYRPPLDIEALRVLAGALAEPGGEVTEPGAWGPWVDGGAWLVVEGTPVDWIYRDVDRVRAAWRDARAGRYSFHAQAGHPLGVPDFAYPGELALGRVLADVTGELARLQGEMAEYPPALADALVAGLWEAEFTLGIARKAVARGDTTYVAGCLFRAVELCAHALHGRAGRWLVNEKGAVAAAGRLAVAPAGFSGRARSVLAGLGTEPASLAAAITAGEALLDDVRKACRER